MILVSIWTKETTVISHGLLNIPPCPVFMLTTLLSPFPLPPGVVLPPKPATSV